MYIYMKNKYEKESTRLRYSDYFKTNQEMLRLRRIVPSEFQAVPKKFRSRLSLAFGSLAGVLFILTVFFALAGLKYCFDNIMAHTSDAWLMLFVFSMVDLLMLLVMGAACLLKADDIVTEDSRVLAGEVTEVHLNRGSRGGVVSADHFIAIHGSRQIVMINNVQPILTGSTVLIVKSPKRRYHLVEIPEEAADFDNVGKDFGEEISEGTIYTADAVKDFEKITLEQVRKEPLTASELAEIPRKFRSAAPFSHGAATVCWIFFTTLTIVMLVILHKARVERNTELFFPLLGGFLCELIIELFVSSAVMGKRLSDKMCYYFDCVVIRKSRDSGLGLISAVIPEKKQYIEILKIDPELYDSLPVNEPVRLYYNTNYPNARYAKRLYDD